MFLFWKRTVRCILLGCVGCFAIACVPGERAASNVSDFPESHEIHAAVLRFDVKGVERELKADPKCVGARSKGNGATPLHYAAGTGQIAVAKMLIDGGADLEARSRGGDTPLMTAVGCFKADMVRYLVACGADPTVSNSDGESVLSLAKSTGKEPVVLIVQSAIARRNRTQRP